MSNKLALKMGLFWENALILNALGDIIYCHGIHVKA